MLAHIKQALQQLEYKTRLQGAYVHRVIAIGLQLLVVHHSAFQFNSLTKITHHCCLQT